MKQQVKDDWIINNQNIFGLQPDIALSLSCIQYEIHNQIEEKSIKSISDYLGAEIDISKEIRLTKKLTIKKILVDFLGFESFNTLNQNTFSCRMILCYLQLSLLKEYIEKKHKNILTFAEYKTHYSSMLNSFLTSNIDTDEQDFIEAELTLCNNLLTELNKPVYSELGILNNILDKPCEFKKNLTNSIDKRVKFIDELSKLKALPPQPTENTKETEDTPKTFEELFYNTDLVAPSIDILKELDPPVIDTDCNYIGKLKGIICVWIDELQRQGIVKHYSDRKIFASLIPQKIKRFSIDESMFGKYQSKAENNYRTDIKTKVSKIKLSQNSH